MSRNTVQHIPEDDSSEDEYADATFDGLHSGIDNINIAQISNSNDQTSWNSSKPTMSEAELRKKIQDIHANRDMNAKEKARAMQVLNIFI
jgi:hypothetical protein